MGRRPRGAACVFINNLKCTGLVFHFFLFPPPPRPSRFCFQKVDLRRGNTQKKYTYDKHDIKYQLIFICSCTALSQRSVLIIFKVTLNEAVMYESK